jgi:short-chain fatty acids transporter
MAEAQAGVKDTNSKESGLARFGLTLADWSERWFPDALVFALLGIVVVV